MQFKIGDKVRCYCTDGGRHGVTGTVSKIKQDRYIFCDDWSDGLLAFILCDDLEIEELYSRHTIKYDKGVHFCTECGKIIPGKLVGAENYKKVVCIGTELISICPYSKFSAKTGKRQYVYKYRCSNYKIFSSHANFLVDDVVTLNNWGDELCDCIHYGNWI